MTEIFRTVLNMSITGAYIAAAIIILRIAMKKLPKKYSYLLWAILGIRLLCPFSFSSAVSVFNVLVPEKPEVSYGQMEFIPNDIEYSEEPQITVSVPPVNEKINEQLPPAQPNNSANPMQIAMAVGAYIWAAGTLAMLVYTAVSYISVKKKVKSAALSDGNVYTCASIETPFVFGIIKPRIYLPENISSEDRTYIIAHEQAHISRKDNIVKLVAMAALCVHWFNPMVWVSYRLMTKDMELSCDEKALGGFDTDVKKAYANALLNISLKQNKLALGGVLNFGESDIKSRIKGVLGAKKPKVIVTIIAVIAVIIAAVCLLTNAVKKEKEFAPIPDGVYVTDKLLYTAPYKDSYWGDDNGLTYEIKGNTITISGKTYKLSEPMEIPYTDAEWNKAYDNTAGLGWQDGEKNLGDYDNKYCFALQSDEDGGLELYLFVMDDELWYVTYGWEIYRLKLAADDTELSQNDIAEEDTPILSDDGELTLETENSERPAYMKPTLAELTSVCDSYLTDYWSYITKTGELDPKKYTSDENTAELIEMEKLEFADTVSHGIDKVEVEIAYHNVEYDTIGDITWTYIRSYSVNWINGEEILRTEQGYNAYFEFNSAGDKFDLICEIDVWRWHKELGINPEPYEFPLDIDISEAAKKIYAGQEHSQDMDIISEIGLPDVIESSEWWDMIFCSDSWIDIDSLRNTVEIDGVPEYSEYRITDDLPQFIPNIEKALGTELELADGYYKCPFTTVEEVKKNAQRLFSDNYIETAYKNFPAIKEYNGSIYARFGGKGYPGGWIANAYIYDSSDSFIDFSATFVDGTIGTYYKRYRMIKENGSWKIDEINYID